MSTSLVPRSLFARLVDDAAVFPPGLAPVPVALSEHRALRAGGYADLVGPLLIGASAAGELAQAATDAEPTETSEPVEVGVIARPGTPVEDLLAAVDLLGHAPGLGVASVEVAHDPAGGWRRALELGIPVAVEVTTDPQAQARALSELSELSGAGHADDTRAPLIAKLRTQSTPQTPVPSAHEVADFILATAGHGLPFKLTGGLHHAVAGDRAAQQGAPGSLEFQHGVLNVILATHQGGLGAPAAELAETLAATDEALLVAQVRELDAPAIAGLRARFVSFGCCGVLDPLGEIAALGLLADQP